MRLAYVAPYQGAALVSQRPTVRNFSLAARMKIALISELLTGLGHSVDVIAQGEVIEPTLRLYPGFADPEPFHPHVPVQYASALPIRGLNGVWSALHTRRIFKRRHDFARYDAVWIYNLKLPQIACADAALADGVPVVLQYEDDSFADVWGRNDVGLRSGWQRAAIRRVFSRVSACAAVSPYLLAQLPDSIPKLLLRGVVSEAIIRAQQSAKNNWVVFSGTHEHSQGLRQLIEAWKKDAPEGWQLHIAGIGPLTSRLEALAGTDNTIKFHGLLGREENARLLCAAKIGMNPQDPTEKPGNVFAFKIIEYLAAGLHVITTPRGAVEPDLQRGITYLADNNPDTVGETLKAVIDTKKYQCTAEAAAKQTYGPASVSTALQRLLEAAVQRSSVIAS